MIRPNRSLLLAAVSGIVLAACGEDSTTNPPAPAPAPQSSNGITLLSPNGGESFKIGDKLPVSWTSTNPSFTLANMTIDCGSREWFGLVTSGIDVDLGDTALVIPDSVYSPSARKLIAFPVGGGCKVKISDYTLTAILDTSDTPFTVLPK